MYALRALLKMNSSSQYNRDCSRGSSEMFSSRAVVAARGFSPPRSSIISAACEKEKVLVINSR